MSGTYEMAWVHCIALQAAHLPEGMNISSSLSGRNDIAGGESPQG